MFNDIFWMLYWIDVLSTLPKQLGFGSVVGAIFGMFVVISLDHAESVIRGQSIKKAFMFAFLPIFVSFMALSFIPERQTMYMMLAVRTTDHAVNSEIGQKLQRLLNQQLDKYIDQLERKKEK